MDFYGPSGPDGGGPSNLMQTALQSLLRQQDTSPGYYGGSPASNPLLRPTDEPGFPKVQPGLIKQYMAHLMQIGPNGGGGGAPDNSAPPPPAPQQMQQPQPQQQQPQIGVRVAHVDPTTGLADAGGNTPLPTGPSPTHRVVHIASPLDNFNDRFLGEAPADDPFARAALRLRRGTHIAPKPDDYADNVETLGDYGASPVKMVRGAAALARVYPKIAAALAGSAMMLPQGAYSK